MTPSPEGSDALDHVGQAADQAVETVESAAAETVLVAGEATDVVAEVAQDVNDSVADHVASVSSETAEAFGAARDRLNTLAEAAPLGSQALLASLTSGSESLGKGMEAGYKNATAGMAEFNSKALEAWRTNAEAAIAHWKNLVSAKTLSEAIALNAEHTRRQMETMSAQTRDLTALAGRIARGAVDPLKPQGH